MREKKSVDARGPSSIVQAYQGTCPYHKDEAVVVGPIVDIHLLALLVGQQRLDLVRLCLCAEATLGLGVGGMVEEIEHGRQSNVVGSVLLFGIEVDATSIDWINQE